MRYSSVFGHYEIFVEVRKGEKEEDVLRAIATASFELALGDDGIQPRVSEAETRALIGASIKMSDKSGDTVINMSQVGGRWCTTYVVRRGPNHFGLCNVFRSSRGVPDEMLERARQILKFGGAVV